MKLILLGTGTPILEANRQASAVLLQLDEMTLLFDAGRGVNTQLARLDVSPADIDAIFITHHHWDHIGDLGDVLLAAWHEGRSDPIYVYGPQGTRVIIDTLLNIVFRREISFSRMMNTQLNRDAIDIFQLVHVSEIEPGTVNLSNDCNVTAAYVDHGASFMPADDWPCFGYRVEAQGKIITLSGDTIPCAGLDQLAKDADFLLMCCYLAEAEITNPASELLSNQVIASSGQVGKVAAKAQAKQLVLTHFRKKSAEMMQSILADVKKDYRGEVILGEDLMEFDL